MARLCERPGCSDEAAVAYGMRADDLVFWLDTLDGHTPNESGALCLRHANSMVVPRGWTLDDLRDPDLRLFRPPVASGAPSRPRRRAPRSVDPTGEQLELGAVDVAPTELAPPSTARVASSAELVADPPAELVASPVASSVDPSVELVADPPAELVVSPVASPVASSVDPSAPWVPDFDADDDLGGLLAARSPLLARAFRGDDRPR